MGRLSLGIHRHSQVPRRLRPRYSNRYVSCLRVPDVAIFLLAFNKWASQVQPAIPMNISRWIFSGCIIFSFLLLAKDWWTARKIIRSRDISFAYTNLIGITSGDAQAHVANRWYSIRGGYAYYCLFDKLGESRHAWDSVAFFVFFSFKGFYSIFIR
jgi:hypothetical protein